MSSSQHVWRSWPWSEEGLGQFEDDESHCENRKLTSTIVSNALWSRRTLMWERCLQCCVSSSLFLWKEDPCIFFLSSKVVLEYKETVRVGPSLNLSKDFGCIHRSLTHWHFSLSLSFTLSPSLLQVVRQTRLIMDPDPDTSTLKNYPSQPPPPSDGKTPNVIIVGAGIGKEERLPEKSFLIMKVVWQKESKQSTTTGSVPFFGVIRVTINTPSLQRRSIPCDLAG